MSDVVIKVENLSKEYRLGTINHGTLKHDLQSWWARLRGKEDPNALIARHRHLDPSNDNERFWALQNITFTVNRGDVVGIIGRNGAGKSTLLKILSRVTAPTQGTVKIKGRVASLLEVGTGFHPELTGRENIFLNGAILGMSKQEIRKKFDQIVDFAEIGKFIDTPVKRYSSGMYVRLAFAVAAHLEPEILIVDEVLAVGDAQFQKKCLGKMDDVSKNEGRTILFVSHNMSMVESLCKRGILLESGTLCRNGTIEEVVSVYLEKTYSTSKVLSLEQRKDRSGSGKVRASSFSVLNEEGKEEHALQSGKDYLFVIGYINHTNEYLDDVIVSLDIFDEKGVRVLLLRTNFTNSNITLNPESGDIICKIQNLPLANGLYRFSIFISHADTEVLDYIENAASVNVEGGDFFGTGSCGLPSHCKMLFKDQWSTKQHILNNMK